MVRSSRVVIFQVLRGARARSPPALPAAPPAPRRRSPRSRRAAPCRAPPRGASRRKACGVWTSQRPVAVQRGLRGAVLARALHRLPHRQPAGGGAGGPGRREHPRDERGGDERPHRVVDQHPLGIAGPPGARATPTPAVPPRPRPLREYAGHPVAASSRRVASTRAAGTATTRPVTQAARARARRVWTRSGAPPRPRYCLGRRAPMRVPVPPAGTTTTAFLNVADSSVGAGRAKIIRPAVVCSTLVTVTSSIWPM